jgi:hypothetical protein
MTTNSLKKYIDIVNESLNDEMDAPRVDRRAGTQGQLRDEIFGYLDDAHQAIDAGDKERAHELISYVYELVDDNL